MGLAASQGRLLTITARKADCEFESMSLSHQKIALARDMEKISDEYQQAMNQTKLVYDLYGAGTSDIVLNYGLLMTPSVYNDYYPKFITDAQNRVVLSSIYANAAKAAGIPHEGYNGTPSSEIRNAFLESLCDSGVISVTTLGNAESTTYNNAIGLGGASSSTVGTMEITYDELLNMIKVNCEDTYEYGLYMGKLPDNYPGVNLSCHSRNGDGVKLFAWGDGNAATVYGQGCASENCKINLYDLLKGKTEYVYSFDTGRGPCTPLTEAALAQQAIVGEGIGTSFLDWLVDQFGSILGGVEQNDLALQYAYDKIVGLVYPNEDIQNLAEAWSLTDLQVKNRKEQSLDTQNNKDNNSQLLDVISTSTQDCWDCDKTSSVAFDAKSYIGFTRSGCARDAVGTFGGWPDTVSSVAIDLNTLTKVFLTAYVEFLQGAGNSNYSYNKGLLSEASLYNPKDDDKFVITAPSDYTPDEESLESAFYDAMFNIICVNGWTENKNIENTEYMQELLKTGAVYISSMDNDAFYHQSGYSTDPCVLEVTDTEAIAKAEAKYNALKLKIENKENRIDVKMKNLDTEISSLTQEYDSVKSIISKAIEKSFKRYDA